MGIDPRLLIWPVRSALARHRGKDKQPTQRTSDGSLLETWTDSPWIGGDPNTHALYSRYVVHLKTESRALLWLADEDFEQEYTQEEIAAGCDLSPSTGMAADQVNDPYAQALAKHFSGIGRSSISRKHDEIQQWLRRLQSTPRVFPTWRPPSPPADFLVPADETCRYCGGCCWRYGWTPCVCGCSQLPLGRMWPISPNAASIAETALTASH